MQFGIGRHAMQFGRALLHDAIEPKLGSCEPMGRSVGNRRPSAGLELRFAETKMFLFGWKPHPPRNRSEAWTCVMANLVACPGVGTLMAGRKIGYAQGGLAVAGAIPLAGYISWFSFQKFNALLNVEGNLHAAAGYGPWWIGAVGLGIFALAWLWSLVSSIQILFSPPTTDNLGVPPKIS
jgi:hypothetical protein